jgi:transposase
MNESATFVGLDVHKLEHAVAMYLPEQTEPQQWTVKDNPTEIARMVRRVEKLALGPVVFAYKAGVFGFALQRLIHEHGAACQVIAPALTPVAELYAIERFGRPRELMGYLGLTPSEQSSGQTRRTGTSRVARHGTDIAVQSRGAGSRTALITARIGAMRGVARR